MGRKKTPTRIKEMQGTVEKSRAVKNEMQVDECKRIPRPPAMLSKLGKKEWKKITSQLFNLNMLHNVDLSLIQAYCNEISLYLECEEKLREEGRARELVIVTESIGPDGTRTKKIEVKGYTTDPHQKIAKDALTNAMRLASNFGITPTARASISAPKIQVENQQINNFFD